MSGVGAGRGSVPTRAEPNLPAVRLRAVALDEALALLEGAGSPSGLRWHAEYPTTETFQALGLTLAAHQAMAASTTGGSVTALGTQTRWGLSQVVLDGVVVGDAGFHGPPAADGPVEVEIGYSVVAPLRGRGIATAACLLLLAQAWSAGAEVVRAETDPGNAASRRVLQRCGFHQGADGLWVVRRDRDVP